MPPGQVQQGLSQGKEDLEKVWWDGNWRQSGEGHDQGHPAGQ